MLKKLSSSIFAALALVLTMPAHADNVSLKANISEARQKLKDIVGGADVAPNKKAIADLTTKIDAEVDTVPGLKGVWTEFKATRDGAIIPAFESGKAEEIAKAKSLATGVQAERFKKMMDLLQ